MGLHILKEPTRTFKVNKGRLIQENALALETNTHLVRIIARLPKTSTPTSTNGKQQLAISGHQQDKIALTESYCWKDKRDFFNTDTHRMWDHMREMLGKGNALHHVSVVK